MKMKKFFSDTLGIDCEEPENIETSDKPEYAELKKSLLIRIPLIEMLFGYRKEKENTKKKNFKGQENIKVQPIKEKMQQIVNDDNENAKNRKIKAEEEEDKKRKENARMQQIANDIQSEKSRE